MAYRPDEPKEMAVPAADESEVTAPAEAEQQRRVAEMREALRPRTPVEQERARRLARVRRVILHSRRLWHTTSEARFRDILDAGAILPEPPLPDSERWGTAEGPTGYPLARSLGGISLFDFVGFPGLEAYERDYPMSSLRSFVPVRVGWESSVWIEIDRDAIAAGFRAAKVLRALGSADLRRNRMPLVEATHLGPLPATAFRRVFRIDRANGSVTRLRG